jgi:hypothetical protein
MLLKASWAVSLDEVSPHIEPETGTTTHLLSRGNRSPRAGAACTHLSSQQAWVAADLPLLGQ